jgi:chemotaxis signal transduction protein
MPVQRARASASADFLIFRAGGARYALSLVALREAAPLPAIAAVPGAAQTVRGVMPWRGEFATVFDIAAALGLAAHDGATAFAIVLRQGAPRMALAIESAEGAARIDTADMRAADAWQAGRADLLRGATADGVAILDEARLRARLSEELRAA